MSLLDDVRWKLRWCADGEWSVRITPAEAEVLLDALPGRVLIRAEEVDVIAEESRPRDWGPAEDWYCGCPHPWRFENNSRKMQSAGTRYCDLCGEFAPWTAESRQREMRRRTPEPDPALAPEVTVVSRDGGTDVPGGYEYGPPA